MIEDYNVQIFALSGGPRGSVVQVFREPEKAVRALIRHYRLHSKSEKWNVAFVRLKHDEMTPVSLTEAIREVFREGAGQEVSMRTGNEEYSLWKQQVSEELLEAIV